MTERKKRLTRAEKLRLQVARSRALHMGRLAQAGTPQLRAAAVWDRIRAVMKRADVDRIDEIAAKFVADGTRLADVEDERFVRGSRGRG